MLFRMHFLPTRSLCDSVRQSICQDVKDGTDVLSGQRTDESQHNLVVNPVSGSQETTLILAAENSRQ